MGDPLFQFWRHTLRPSPLQAAPGHPCSQGSFSRLSLEVVRKAVGSGSQPNKVAAKDVRQPAWGRSANWAARPSAGRPLGQERSAATLLADPQFAYLPHSSTGASSSIVSRYGSWAKGKDKRQTLRERRMACCRQTCVGGSQLCVDLSEAV